MDSPNGRPVTDHEDWETVMVTAPVIHELGSPPSREDSTGRVPFIFKLSGRLDGLPPGVNQSCSPGSQARGPKGCFGCTGLLGGYSSQPS
jgi:hypothetical protein